jgi:hypothetical protein
MFGHGFQPQDAGRLVRAWLRCRGRFRYAFGSATVIGTLF